MNEKGHINIVALTTHIVLSSDAVLEPDNVVLCSVSCS